MSPGAGDGHQERVLFAQYAHPAAFPPVERAATILHESGWRVRIIGASGTETDPLASESSLDVRLVSRRGTGLRQKARYAWFLLVGASHLLRWRPKWVYASDAFATPLGLLAAMLGFRVVYHEHDAPIDERPSAFARAILAARARLLRLAAVIVTPNADRSAAASAEAGGRAVVTVWNCPLRREIPARQARSEDEPARLVYHGSIGRDRPPLAIVDAMARVSTPLELEVAGYETIGSRGLVDELRRRAADLGVAARVRAYPPMPRAALLERAARCDIGLSFMPTDRPNFNERTMAGASNKAFEYLACGVPLLVSPMPDWQRLFVDRGLAFAADPNDADDLARVLRLAVERRDELARMGELGRELVQREWNYETQFRPVRELMERGALAARSAELTSHAT